MEKGLREYLRAWWRLPHEFDWTARYFRARGLMRVHQVAVGSFSLLYGLTALLSVVWATFEGGSLASRILVLAIAASSTVLGVFWIFGPWPTERQSIAFAVYADLAVVAVMACYQDAFISLPGLALLATNGIYIVVVHGPRALLLHLIFTTGVFVWWYVWALVQGTVAVSVLTVRVLALMPPVMGVPVIVQSYLLALRMGALDSLHDPLTRLYNRRGLDTHVGELVEHGETTLGVLAIDIDKFKTVNDRFGHDVGDQVLAAVANAAQVAVLNLGVRSVIARTGGEEFVVVIAGGPHVVRGLAAELHHTISGCDTPTVPTVSIGAATARVNGTDIGKLVRDLMEHADAAMYRAKKAGGNQTVTVDDAVPAED